MTIEIKQLIVKYSTITYTITVGLDFTVIDNDAMYKVSKISYCRKGYNKGYQGDFSAYKIEFKDSTLKMIIPERNIENIVVEKIEKIKKIIPELPDDDSEIELPGDTPETELSDNTVHESLNITFKPLDEDMLSLTNNNSNTTIAPLDNSDAIMTPNHIITPTMSVG